MIPCICNNARFAYALRMTAAICIPTYEPDPGFLREAIDSILAQTDRAWTLFIHDDCSKADVASIVEPYLGDKRIRFARSPIRLGIGGNWNACVRQTVGDVVLFLFQDDVWAPNYVATAKGILSAEKDVGIVSMGHAYRFEGRPSSTDAYKEVEEATRAVQPGKHDGKAFLRTWLAMGLRPNVLGEPSFVALRRSTLERTGEFAETMPQFLDADMWCRCLAVTHWWRVAEEHGFFRVHGAAATARNEETGAGMYDRLQTFERLIAFLDDRALRSIARRARDTALAGMVKKFLTRLRSGKSAGARSGGAGWMRSFALRHPLLVGKSVIRAMLQR